MAGPLPPFCGGEGGGKRVVRCCRGEGSEGGRLGLLAWIPGWDSWLDLATTRSPTPFGAVPWARRGFTAEFGMGSGGARAL